MKIEIFKNKKKFKKGGFHTNPNIGWGIILLVTLFLTVLFLVFGIYLFVNTNKETTVPEADTGSHIKIVKKDRIDKVLEYFSSRENKSSDVLNSPSPLIDPSL
jgi:hypothetical protein